MCQYRATDAALFVSVCHDRAVVTLIDAYMRDNSCRAACAINIKQPHNE